MVDRSIYHRPVMTEQVVDLLRPSLRMGVTVDATFGGGGHTRALLAADRKARVLAIDRDPDAAAQAAGLGKRLMFRAADFRRLDAVLEEEEIDEIAGAVFDLGVSSHQLDVGERGFSYHQRGPLDMRMGPDAPLDAEAIVNTWDRDRLAGTFRRYGEEHHAGRIADAIVAARPIADTAELAAVVADAVPARARRTGHPARRTFQAVRIAVNDELGALAEGLDIALRMLRPGGRLVVISYHSLEDRIVKRRFASGSRGCVCPPDLPVCGCGRTAGLVLLTRKALTPGLDEVAANPRSRSARLRAVARSTE
ncbi:MAG: 16S rRNA (cytosine(1402)-N(4))-methyltransferase RsmH [Actinobacteria bacterium]|nr:16S rRNA (cytosine(1402)-N(4))-methyltransferase RsmH [Actinomycetota bacterium]MBU1493775.1 16S rRNA (cytosine(1402)-N(4))-methyltransferase RsmH [Actinomycetota bacterium]